MTSYTLPRRSFLTGCSAAAALSMTSHAAFAQGIDPAQLSLRLSRAEELAMLAERGAKVVALIHIGVTTDGMDQDLQAIQTGFDNILQGFRSGEGDSGLTRERNVGIQEFLTSIETIWSNHGTLLADVQASGSASDDDVNTVVVSSVELADTCGQMVKALTRTYGGDTMAAEMSVAIEIAGRQLTLTQKIVRHAALIAQDHETATNVEGMNDSIRLFDLSLAALENGGNQMIVISKPPTAEAAAALAEVRAEWDQLAPMVEAIAANGAVDTATLTDVAARAEALLATSMATMNAYVEANKGAS